MDQQEKITVIIPTYNRAELIGRAVRSVLDQTYTNLEVIVVDDGSTDDTERRVQAIKDDRLRYLRQKNAGASAARNAGVDQATAEIIAFQDSDDCWHPDKLEKQMRYWSAHPECGLIYCAYTLHRVNGEELKIPDEGEIWGKLEGNLFDTLLVNNTVGTPAMLFWKKYFQQVSGFDTSLEALEDWDLALRLSEHIPFGYVSEPLLDAYQLMDGISTRTAGYYYTRCRHISRYRSKLAEMGVLDSVAAGLLLRAEQWGIQSQVRQMLTLALMGQL